MEGAAFGGNTELQRDAPDEGIQFEMASNEELAEHERHHEIAAAGDDSESESSQGGNWREKVTPPSTVDDDDDPIVQTAPETGRKIYNRDDDYIPPKAAPYFAGSVGIVLFCIFLAGWHSGDSRSKYNVDVSGIVSKRIQLPDGRHIAYEERGVSRDAAKRNILVLHGFLSCRLAGIPGLSERLLEKYEARLVAYDRPGIGQSDPHPKQSFNTTAQDMVFIADALGMGEKFWLMGYSGGGPYAWAALHYIPNRLAGVFMFGPMGSPYAKNLTREEVKSVWRQVGRGKRTIYRVARHFPSLLPSFFKRGLIGKPVKIMRSVKKSAPLKDLALLEKDHFGRSWERSLRESMRSGDAKPHAQDYALYCSDWGFKLSDLGPKPVKRRSLFKRIFFFWDRSDLPVFSGPIHIFHGTEDSVVPVAYSLYAKRLLPQVRLHLLEGHGHFSWFCHCDTCHRELFKTLFGEVPGLAELDKAPESDLASPPHTQQPASEEPPSSTLEPHEGQPDVLATATAPEEAGTQKESDVAVHPVVTETQAAISSHADERILEDPGVTETQAAISSHADEKYVEERNIVLSDEDEEDSKKGEEL